MEVGGRFVSRSHSCTWEAHSHCDPADYGVVPGTAFSKLPSRSESGGLVKPGAQFRIAELAAYDFSTLWVSGDRD